MLHTAISDANSSAEPSLAPDYQQIRRAIAFLSETWTEQPSLERLAQHLGLSPAHCQKLFKRWCGLSPKEFVQAITIDRARNLLQGSASLLETAYEVGLSGAGRLHDLFVSHEAMGGIDVSPVVLILILVFIRVVVIRGWLMPLFS